MNEQKISSLEAQTKIANTFAIGGAFMTVMGWAMLWLAEDKDALLVPTSMVIVSMSVLLADRQYDEFYRGLASAGAVYAMVCVVFWTAIMPFLNDHLDPSQGALSQALYNPRFTFYIAATGFFYVWHRRRWRSV